MAATANALVSVSRSFGSNFIKSSDVIEEGDTVIIYINHMVQYVIVVKRGLTIQMKYGALRHEFLIGKRYGTRISASNGYVYPLRVNSSLWTRTLSRQTQILYTPDIGAILLLLEAKPGAVICESGTGSGSLSHAIATAVAPFGHLYTHDVNESRVQTVEKDLKKHGFDCCTAVLRDVCEEGFFVENACDGVFLDVPEPWRAVAAAKRAISAARGGRLVNFSPCIEQVQKVCAELDANGFLQVEVVEIVPRKLKVTGAERESLEDLAARCTPRLNFTRFAATEKKHEDEKSNSGRRGANRKRQRSPPAQFFDEALESFAAGPPKPAAKWMLNVTPFPFNQPTHTGYLVAATLLPRLVAAPIS